MKTIIGSLREYIRLLHWPAFLSISILTAVLILFNYTLGIESRLMALPVLPDRFLGFFLLFTFVYGAAWSLQRIFQPASVYPLRSFIWLLLAAAAIFAAKVTFDWFTVLLTKNLEAPWKKYWYQVLNWPLKALLVLGLVALCWWARRYPMPLAGMRRKGFEVKPYFLLLLMMVPLIAFAATQPDFLRAYPRVERIAFIEPHVNTLWPWKLLFEISYGIDFITIELFFRGFLILAFLPYAGKEVILPMAAFYCSIHFGKPLFECITSYFGGIVLGVVVYNTRSIWGGLMVHLGIAWLMELGGYIGRSWYQ